jgi:hypothetical protein
MATASILKVMNLFFLHVNKRYDYLNTIYIILVTFAQNTLIFALTLFSLNRIVNGV